MSKPVHGGLTLARYGMYLLLFLSYALGQGALPGDRLIALAGLFALLAAVGYVLTEHVDSRRLAAVLMGVELVLMFGIGLVARGGWFSILYFVVVGEAFFFLTAAQSYAVSLVALGVLGVNLYVTTTPFRSGDFLVTMLVMVAGSAFFAAASRLAVEQSEERQRTEGLLKELEAAHGRLQAYALEVETLSVARERQRLAQDVHDAVAHTLTGLLMQLQAIRRLLPADVGAAAARLAIVEEAARHGLDEVRRAVRAMRPEHLEAIGGVDAMRRLCDQFAERTGIRANFLADANLRITPAHEVLLYRTLQECLTNAARHGRASAIWASLSAHDGRIELRIRDDGVGAAAVRPGLGLGGMQERAQAAQGRFSYRTAPEEGFEAVLMLPEGAAVPATSPP